MRTIRTFLTTAAGLIGLGAMILPATAQTIERVSIPTGGGQANGDSGAYTAISADGRFVAFPSFATNLVPGDTNNTTDVFVHDRQTGVTTLVSVDSAGNQLGGQQTAISADGRFVVFGSNGLFVHDRQTGETSQVNVASDGTQGNGTSQFPAISADGRFVAFASNATNLVPGDTNGVPDIFVHDRQTGATTRVSVDSAGNQGNSNSEIPSISADGRFVVFDSFATNLVPGGTVDLQIFLHDRASGHTEQVSVDSAGSQPNLFSGELASISADGRFVAFESFASNLVAGDTNGNPDVFVRDRLTGQVERVSVDSAGNQGNSYSFQPAISANGRFVAFYSVATNLVASGPTNGQAQVYVHDRTTHRTELVSVNSIGVQGNNGSFAPAISADGQFVAFYSSASNFVSGDTNNLQDVFVRDRSQVSVATFIGFESPVENLPFTNSTKAGRVVPVKWQLVDGVGDYLRDLAIIQSLQFANVDCDDQDIAYENPIEAAATGNSGLRYDLEGEHFVFGWDTHKSMANTCAVFILTLADNQQHFARFMLK
jgi:Tol biopolymer transport system component